MCFEVVFTGAWSFLVVNLVVKQRYLSKHEQNNKETKRDVFVEIDFLTIGLYYLLGP